MLLTEEEYLAHYGVLRRSGRYPWGSGRDQPARNRIFLDTVDELEKQGLSPVDIVKGLGLESTTQLRALKSITKNQQKQANITQAQRLKDKGLSNVAIGEKMGLNESSVRALLAPGAKDKADILTTTAEMLKGQVALKKFVDVGAGVETHINVTDNTLKTALVVLKEQGYEVHTIPVDQLGTGQKTNVKVLAPPGTTWGDVKRGQNDIKQIASFSQDFGRTQLGLRPPLSINPKRVKVVYKEEGGAELDGVIYVRPGVKDTHLGGAMYSQVRVMVGDGHFLKGMAMYKNDLPEGIDLQFHTNKPKTANKLEALKPLNKNEDGSVDHDNPFGANIKRQIIEKDKKGNDTVASVMNIVNQEGDWSEWSKTISSQMLSKQSPTLAKNQLDLTFKQRLDEFNKLSQLTNPTVKKRLLEDFGDSTDHSAVHLEAAAIPRTHGHHVILPIQSMAPNEIYAPNYRDGERVVLIRHPHGGPFEIPELVVNNHHPEAKRLLGDAKDAVGINHKVAERLSGADFDGDTVLVIPNNAGKVKTLPALEGLKNFDPQSLYKAYDGMKPIKASTKQTQMGEVSNLITDMTIKGASSSELARAVRHSMVVIDAEKHNLNYRQSAIDNGIAQLKKKYQGQTRGGAATLISRAGSKVTIPERKPRRASLGGSIDPTTGKRVFEDTGSGRTIKVRKLSLTDNAHDLLSGPDHTGIRIERIYADHSNKLKTLANEARKSSVKIPNSVYSQSANKTYSKEVVQLKAALELAKRNAPLERQAQIISNATYKQKLHDNPNMDDATKKKIKFQALTEARNRMGAGKQKIIVTPEQWAAIQAGAISNNMLNNILDHADMDKIRKLATPRQHRLMSRSKTSQARTLLANGHTRAEVADQLGVSLSTLDLAVKGEE